MYVKGGNTVNPIDVLWIPMSILVPSVILLVLGLVLANTNWYQLNATQAKYVLLTAMQYLGIIGVIGGLGGLGTWLFFALLPRP